MDKRSVGSSAGGSSRNIYEKQTSYEANMDEVDLNISETPALGPPFRGMGKEDLLRHSSKPFWRRLRMACIAVVIFSWLALLITVVALVLVYPRCREADVRFWWQKEAIYRIYVRSFKDSNGDGIGDLKGVESELDYIRDMGVRAISLSPIYVSDDQDSDFNVKDHKNIDSNYGNMSDFQSLLKACHDKDMYLILDFIPNHTSDQHDWFIQSSASSERSNELRNYYVWSNSQTNWRTVYNKNSWTNGSTRNQLYLHQFLDSQPDLNLRSSQVQDSLEDIMSFWLDTGVDGFYIRNSGYMFEDYDMRDEDLIQSNSTDQDDYDAYDHKYTYRLPEVYDMIARWRTLLETYSINTTERLLMADVRGDTDVVMSYYGHYERDGVHISLNQGFFDARNKCDGKCIKEFVNGWMTKLPRGRWANWMVGDENSVRLASRFNTSFIRAFTMLTMLLPGTPLIYYGDEIMMSDQNVITSEPWSRAQSMRGLMQWENKTYGGFCNIQNCKQPWINSTDDYQGNNAKVQGTSGDSLLTLYKNLTTLRREDSFVYGEYSLALADDNVFSFVREFDGEKGYLIAINFDDTTHGRNYHSSHNSIEKKATVELTTGNDVGHSNGDQINTDSISLGPHQGIVVSWDYVAEEL